MSTYLDVRGPLAIPLPTSTFSSIAVASLPRLHGTDSDSLLGLSTGSLLEGPRRCRRSLRGKG
eukprot:765438-Hanusia_phi.AAC.4